MDRAHKGRRPQTVLRAVRSRNGHVGRRSVCSPQPAPCLRYAVPALGALVPPGATTIPADVPESGGYGSTWLTHTHSRVDHSAASHDSPSGVRAEHAWVGAGRRHCRLRGCEQTQADLTGLVVVAQGTGIPGELRAAECSPPRAGKWRRRRRDVGSPAPIRAWRASFCTYRLRECAESEYPFAASAAKSMAPYQSHAGRVPRGNSLLLPWIDRTRRDRSASSTHSRVGSGVRHVSRPSVRKRFGKEDSLSQALTLSPIDSVSSPSVPAAYRRDGHRLQTAPTGWSVL